MSHVRRPRPAARSRLVGAIAVLGLLAPALAAAPASADPPAGDDIDSATLIESWPTRLTVDTTEATADAADGPCVDGHSVWFALRPTERERLRMTTAGTSFHTRLAVFAGSRRERELVTCDRRGGPGRTSALSFRAKADQRYWVAVSSLGSEPGGTAVLTVGLVDVPDATVTIESAEAGGVSGRLHVRGTATCTTPSQLWVGAVASQRVESTDGDDGVARGFGSDRVRGCWDEPARWHLRVDSETGLAFQPGAASLGLRIRGWDGIRSYLRHQQVNVTVGVDPDGRPTP